MTHPRTTTRAVIAAVGAVVLAATGLAGCSGGKQKQPATTVRYARTIGPGEGTLNLVAWSGYVEHGSNDPRVDWVTPFERRTQCKVSVKGVSTSQEMTALMSDPNRNYDGVSAPPEVAGGLITEHQAAQLNPDLVDGYKDLQPKLRDLTRQGGKVYGVPFTWGADLVMYDPKVVQSTPTGWSALFDPSQYQPYAGRVVMRDSPLTLADAALYLKSKDHKLGITDPYELTTKQLAAAAAVLKKQHSAVKLYWRQPVDAINVFAGGDAVLGQVWPYHADVLGRAGRSVQAIQPKEGVTGWADSWLMGARAKHPNCMYQWMSWMTAPDVQLQVAQWNEVAAANPGVCSSQRSRPYCDAYHVDDRSYVDRIKFAKNPVRDCGNGGSNCTDYNAWTTAWRQAIS